MPELEELYRQLRAVEEQLAEARARMPAHSAKPGMMSELIDLEDQRERLLEQIEAAKSSPFSSQ
ncbi:MAG: hypothetical protein R6X08_10945 [Desulfosalsimonadaceae bacterium]